MDHSTIVIVTSFHIVMVLVVTLINVTMANRRQASVVDKDNRRLRVALHAELKQLHELYCGNIERLEREAPSVLSSKSLTPIFRGNVGRLTLLHEAEIPSIIATYSLNEYIEGLVATTCKAQGGFAYILIEDKTPLEVLHKAYQRGKRQVEETIDHLEGHMLASIGQGKKTTRRNEISLSKAETTRMPIVGSESLQVQGQNVPANAIRNNTMQGAVPGSPGRLPGYWKCGGIPGITRTILDVGVQDGVDYIDIHLGGTVASDASLSFEFEENKLIPATFRQTWTGSCFLRLLQDDVVFDKHPLRLEISERGNDGSMLSGLNKIVFNRTDWQRAAKSVTLGNPSTAYIIFRLVTTPIKSGTTLNFTIRIGSPQLELGAAPSAPIATDGVEARSADIVSLTRLGRAANVP